MRVGPQATPSFALLLSPEGRGDAGSAGAGASASFAPLLPPGDGPASEAEVCERVAEAAASGRALEIVGGGTRGGLGRPVEGERLSTATLDGVALYEPAALTLVAGAGARLSEIEARLAAEGQRLPFEPMDHRPLLGSSGESTLGGVVAANVSGPRRVQAGACRDSLIGVRFVDGTGRAIKSGGRVMKNVTGLDLVKLLAGSYGTLGVLTEVAFKLQPIPEAAATLTLRGLDDGRAIRAMVAALGSPFDPSGAAHEPEAEGGPATHVRLEGFAASVAYRAKQLAARLSDFGEAAVEDDPARVAALWRRLRDVEAFAGRPGAVWRVSVRPTEAPALVAALREAGVAEAAFYDRGGALVWLLAPEEADAGAGAIRREAKARRGHATLVRASAATRARVEPFEPEPPVVARLSEALRAKFDPKRVLNPGRMRPLR